MDGVILFADNKVLEEGGFEYGLYRRLCDDGLSVLPIDNLETLEATIKSMSTFKALILDWNFDKNNLTKDEDLSLPPSTPERLLNDVSLYSLIYVYSQSEVADDKKDTLRQRFPNKIHFFLKAQNGGLDEAVKNDSDKIESEINAFEKDNEHMEIPFKWSQAINQSVQSIFAELEQATPNWVKEICDAVQNDGGEPATELINVFNNLLSESLIQNNKLRKSIREYNCNVENIVKENTARLYQRVLYTKVIQEAPITTGEIFRFDEGQYGILVTPECDISKRDVSEFFLFAENGFQDYINKIFQGQANSNGLTPNQKKQLVKSFNNNELSAHILPSFPFNEEINNKPAYIDFRATLSIKKKEEYQDKRIWYKLNSPYIQQLRQRFVSFFGRYGVPALPDSLKDYNLSNF